MIVDERITAYIRSLYRGNTPFLDQLEQEALAEHVPVIKKETQSLIRFLLAAVRPGAILEIGAGVGFSALLMNQYGGCPVTTIELNEKRFRTAAAYIEAAGKTKEISLLFGDAKEILPKLSGQYDFIFLDAAKGQYLNLLPEILAHLSVGGLLLTDNVLQGGDVTESRFAVTRRNRTIHARMREYLFQVRNHPDLETAILPVGDGVTVSSKRKAAQDAAL